MSERRLLLVHAHPDDESTGTGATMARYASDSTAVTLVTCTRGEHGEVVAEDLAYLRDAGPDALGTHREAEIATALRSFGGVRHYWLGGLGRWRDSGMADTEPNTAPGAFAAADPEETTRAMVAILRAERPHVAVTYDENGGYGHPDHIQAHRTLMSALEPAADPSYAPELGEPWQVSKVYWTAIPLSTIQRAVDVGALNSVDDMPFAVPDEHLTARIDGRPWHATKLAALGAYRSQVNLDDGFFANLVRHEDFSLEHFQLVRGERGPGDGPHGWEEDLFAGIA